MAVQRCHCNWKKISLSYRSIAFIVTPHYNLKLISQMRCKQGFLWISSFYLFVCWIIFFFLKSVERAETLLNIKLSIGSNSDDPVSIWCDYLMQYLHTNLLFPLSHQIYLPWLTSIWWIEAYWIECEVVTHKHTHNVNPNRWSDAVISSNEFWCHHFGCDGRVPNFLSITLRQKK